MKDNYREIRQRVQQVSIENGRSLNLTSAITSFFHENVYLLNLYLFVNTKYNSVKTK